MVDWAPVESLPPVVGDRHQLQQVLVNLVCNAQHALRAARGERRLRVQADATAGRVRLQVADTGPGIPATHLDRIFDQYFTTKEQGVGTGLGLAIAARIAADHGGSIHARSEPGGGAVFTIDLPAGRRARRVVADDAAAAGRGAGARVLVVEDEDSFRLLLEEALAEGEYQVTTAAHGAAALEILAAAEFDAVVSDLRMPVMDGVQFFHQVRDQRPDLAGRFVFMTGDLLDQGTRTFLEECGAPCLPKPFGLEELHQALRRLPPR
jgi:two-component system NtrC family sensor kinase